VELLWRISAFLVIAESRIYTCFLSLGVAFGLIIDGLISINLTWRYMYYVAVALIGFCTVIVIFFFPETYYPRIIVDPSTADAEFISAREGGYVPPKKSFLKSMALFSGVHTRESLFRMFIRPVGLIMIPPVLWASLVMSVTIGFLVAVTSNVAPAFQQFYNFQPWQAGLCNISAVIGSLLAIYMGGNLSDRVADFFTKRNGGIREPEFRLPAMCISLVTGPLALVFYGVGINNGIHWILPTIGLGLRTSRRK
jgi:MFS family permease